MNRLNHTISRNLFNTMTIGSYFEPIAQLIKPEYITDTPNSKITRVFYENKNCYTLEIKPHKRWKGFKAGQCVKLSLHKDGAFLSRFFSISSSPSEYLDTGTIQLTIRSQKEGLVTPWLPNNLKKGDAVYLSDAQGEFVCRQSKHPKLFIAGGSGITPIISMLKEHQNEDWMNDAHVLFYVRSPSESLFTQTLNDLSHKGLSFEFIFTSQEGRFSFSHIQNHIADIQKRDVYICGPEGMIDQVEQELLEHHVPSSQIFYELFAPRKRKSLNEMNTSISGDKEAIFIDYQRSNKEHKINQTNLTLLELAESQGLKPVSGCRIGVCHQCICKKKSGRVYNTKTQTVSDSGEEEIQLCLSVPVEDVTLDI